MIEQPLSGVPAWVDWLDGQSLPLLAPIRAALPRLLAREADVHAVTNLAYRDALLAAGLWSLLPPVRRQNKAGDLSTLERVVLMTGIDTVLQACLKRPILPDLLGQQRAALSWAHLLLQRSRLATVCAELLAKQRHDIDAHEVMTAALLRDLVEILLTIHAPKLVGRIVALQRNDSQLRSGMAQKMVFGFPFVELQLALVEHWHLPAVLLQLMDERHANVPRVRTVATAVAFARHVTRGWHDTALPSDYQQIADLCRIPADAAYRLAQSAAIRAARDWRWYGIAPPAAMLPALS
ncbi:HDOD domain-containing protein [Chitinimonas lacunae]|uniref:HDOD domain-containing protein n=1 Tax=Chitinimonas lacunae TaxID=1963018 RepID=A0ABV8MR56_9NEIS